MSSLRIETLDENCFYIGLYTLYFCQDSIWTEILCMKIGLLLVIPGCIRGFLV